MPQNRELVLERLAPGEHDCSDFDCREPTLTEFLQKEATVYISRGFCSLWVSTIRGSRKVIGYFTLSCSSIRPSELLSILRDQFSFPKHSVPVILLGKVARAKCLDGERFGEHGMKAGEFLVDLALAEAWKSSQHIASIGVILHAANDKLANYYESGWGFSQYAKVNPDGRVPMIMTMEQISKYLSA